MKIQLYIISSDRDIASSDFKLGITSNYKSRLSSYRTSHPPRLNSMLYYLAIIETVGTKQDYTILDTAMKLYFAPYRICDGESQNEWHNIEYHSLIMLFAKFCYVNSLHWLHLQTLISCPISVNKCIEISQILSQEPLSTQYFIAHDIKFTNLDATQAINRIISINTSQVYATALDIIKTGVQPHNFALHPVIFHRISELSNIMIQHTGIGCKDEYAISTTTTYLNQYNLAIAHIREAMHLDINWDNIKVIDMDVQANDTDPKTEISYDSDSNYKVSEDTASYSDYSDSTHIDTKLATLTQSIKLT